MNPAPDVVCSLEFHPIICQFASLKTPSWSTWSSPPTPNTDFQGFPKGDSYPWFRGKKWGSTHWRSMFGQGVKFWKWQIINPNGEDMLNLILVCFGLVKSPSRNAFCVTVLKRLGLTWSNCRISQMPMVMSDFCQQIIWWKTKMCLGTDRFRSCDLTLRPDARQCGREHGWGGTPATQGWEWCRVASCGGFPHVHLQGVEDVKVNHFVMHTSLLMP